MKKALHTAVGLFLLLGLLAIAYLSFGVGTPWQRASQKHIIAAFSNASGIKPGNRVEISGVRIGKVSQMEFDAESGNALVHLALDQNIDIPDDTIASVRTAGLIGETYIALQIGGSPILINDGEILYDTEPAVSITELISRVAFGSLENKNETPEE